MFACLFACLFVCLFALFIHLVVNPSLTLLLSLLWFLAAIKLTWALEANACAPIYQFTDPGEGWTGGLAGQLEEKGSDCGFEPQTSRSIFS